MLSARAIASVPAAIVAGKEMPYWTTLIAPSTVISGRTAPRARSSASRSVSRALEASVRRRNPRTGARTSARNITSAGDPPGPAISVYRSSNSSPPGAPLAISRAPAMMSMRRALVSSTRSRQRGDLVDRGRDVGEGAVADVRGEGVEEQVDGDGRGRPGHLAGGHAQADRRLAGTAAGRWEAAAQLLAADPFDQVVGRRVLGDDRVGPVEQPSGRWGHPGVEDGPRGEPQPADPVPGVGGQPAGELPRPRGRGGRAALHGDGRRVVERLGDRLVRSDRGAGQVPGPRRGTVRQRRRQAPGGRRAARRGERRGTPPSASTGGGTSARCRRG